jgi:cholest-4-en-3-one 26-monooxygenase
MRLDEIDLYDPDSFVESVPHEMLATLRREAPVYWHPYPDREGGFWCVTRHADLVAVNRDAELFSSAAGAVFIDTPEEDQLAMLRLMMLNMDPPEHTKLRKIVNRGFTPRRIRELQDILTARARSIVDDVIEKGECEFVSDLACELPLQAIAEFLGVPQEDRRLIFEWSNTMIGSNDPDFARSHEDIEAASAQLYAYAEGLAEARRTNPRDDIVTNLITAEVDGEALTTHEFDLFFLLLAVAGNETTRNAISHGMLALIEHPEQRQRLLDDPSLIDTAIEEILRWASPVMNFRRTPVRDVEMHGVQIRAGDPVVMWHISANRDEDVFDDPFSFDVGREQNPHTMSTHVAFGGGGPHFCLGANLARAEMKVVFQEVLARIPDMELDGAVHRLRSNFINGIKEMPVRFTPGPRVDR